MDSSVRHRQLPVVPGRPLFCASDWRSARERAGSGDDFSRTQSSSSSQASSVDSSSQGEDKSREGRLLRELQSVEGPSTSDSIGKSYDLVPLLDEIDHFVFSFPRSILARVSSSASFSQAVESTASSSVYDDEEDGSVMSLGHSEGSHASGQGVERTISNGSVMSVRHSEDSHAIGQGVERAISDSMYSQGHAESTRGSDQVNDGNATHSIVSGADGHEVVYCEDRLSSLLSQEAAQELSLPDHLLRTVKSPIGEPNRSTTTSLSSKIETAIPAMNASAPLTRTPDVGSKPSKASLASKLTASSSMGSRVGRCRDEEYDGLMVRLVNSHPSIVGQEVECRIMMDEPDHENYGHVIDFMVSDAGGQEVEYSNHRASSPHSPDTTQELNLPDDKHHHAMKEPAPPALLALMLTANSSMGSQVGRRHDEENGGFLVVPSTTAPGGVTPRAPVQSSPKAAHSPWQQFKPEPRQQTIESTNVRDEGDVAEEAETAPSQSVEKSSATAPVMNTSKLASEGAQNAKTPRRLQKPSPEEKSVKLKSSRAVSSSRKDHISVDATTDSPSSKTETKSSAEHTLSKKSHALESKHGTTGSSILKTLLSSVFGESRCNCSGVAESKNETEEFERNDVDKIECILHSGELDDPMNAKIEIQTAPSMTPVTAPCQGNARSASALKSIWKRLPRRRPESRSLHGHRKSKQISEQTEGRNDTEETRVRRGGSTAVKIDKTRRDQSLIPSKILRPHPESRFLRGHRGRHGMPEQNQTPEKKIEEPKEIMPFDSGDFWD